MEEDAGKLVHAGSDRLAGSKYSLVDYNRAGIALCEIVSKPDIRSGKEASEYASEIRRTVRYLGVSDGDMQEGSLRCDVNISVRKGLTEILTSQRNEPSCIFPSDTPRYLTVLLILSLIHI